MGTVIDHIALSHARWPNRHSALRLTRKAARACLDAAGRDPREVDLLVNAGIYRDRNLGEPALAAMIQDDIGANPEDPHTGSHGTFSFDVANGSCGVLTALQVVDGFLASRVVDCALVVASDADPGHGMSEGFPFTPAGASLLCSWASGDRGLGPVYWETSPADRDAFTATVEMVGHRNMLRFHETAALDKVYATVSARVVTRCLSDAEVAIEDVDAVVAAPARRGYRAELAAQLGVPLDRVAVADDERMHTAALAAALCSAARDTGRGRLVLVVAAGAGVTAGAALYRA